MARLSFHLLLSFFLFSAVWRPSSAAKKQYVVYLGGHDHSLEEAASVDHTKIVDSHRELLGSVLGSKENAQDSMFYSYTKSINGFAAHLEEEEAKELEKHPDVVSVFPNGGRRPQSTRVPQFFGLEKKDGHVPDYSLWAKTDFGKDVIIANLDLGVRSGIPAFYDEGMGPVPSRWKGGCENGKDPKPRATIECNRKLIGAKSFLEGYKHFVLTMENQTESKQLMADNDFNPYDNFGHGFATLALAGGQSVPGVSFRGFANGTLKSSAPGARVAAYKVGGIPAPRTGFCCFDVDIIAAFDTGIHDGVDVFSVSLSSDDPTSTTLHDGVAIGSFHALKHGIPVVTCSGNERFDENANNIPWVLTVGGTTIDREFVAHVLLGNDKKIKGQSMSRAEFPPNKMYPLVNAAAAAAPNVPSEYASVCFNHTLDPEKVKGKIVVCRCGGYNPFLTDKSIIVKEAGGVGIIVYTEDPPSEVIPADYVIPGSLINSEDAKVLFNYMNSTDSPVGHITPARTEFGVKSAPMVSYTSSRGPNRIHPEILKPDIGAPGYAILWDRSEAGNFFWTPETGTSIATPIAAGLVALLKSLYPDWTPSAIKSAIMTTARRVKYNSPFGISTADPVPGYATRAVPFDIGAGMIDPNAAADPGLVYDIAIEDYLAILCAEKNISSQILAKFTQGPYECPSEHLRLIDLNLPSITVPLLDGPETVTRRLKNVGTPGTYKVKVKQPKGVRVEVHPDVLEFEKVGEEKEYKISFSYSKPTNYTFGSLKWTDGKHVVRSPIVARTHEFKDTRWLPK